MFVFIHCFFFYIISKIIFEVPEENCSGSVSPPALEPLSNNSSYGNYNSFSSFNNHDLTRMTIEQLQAIAIWQDAQIQHHNRYLTEKKTSSTSNREQHLLLNACNKLSQLQAKVTHLVIT